MVRLALLCGLAVVVLVPAVADAASPRPSLIADQFLAGATRSEAQTHKLLSRLGKAPEPLARRCLFDKLRRLRRCVKTARRARRNVKGTVSVKLTRAYVEAIILAEEARQCQRLVGLKPIPSGSRSKTQVTLEIDPSVMPDRFDPHASTW